jgi:hypothetical protein
MHRIARKLSFLARRHEIDLETRFGGAVILVDPELGLPGVGRHDCGMSTVARKAFARLYRTDQSAKAEIRDCSRSDRSQWANDGDGFKSSRWIRWINGSILRTLRR